MMETKWKFPSRSPVKREVAWVPFQESPGILLSEEKDLGRKYGNYQRGRSLSQLYFRWYHSYPIFTKGKQVVGNGDLYRRHHSVTHMSNNFYRGGPWWYKGMFWVINIGHVAYKMVSSNSIQKTVSHSQVHAGFRNVACPDSLTKLTEVKLEQD